MRLHGDRGRGRKTSLASPLHCDAGPVPNITPLLSTRFPTAAHPHGRHANITPSELPTGDSPENSDRDKSFMVPKVKNLAPPHFANEIRPSDGWSSHPQESRTSLVTHLGSPRVIPRSDGWDLNRTALCQTDHLTARHAIHLV